MKGQGNNDLVYEKFWWITFGFQATSLFTYDFSTLYATLPHNLIKENLLDLTEQTLMKRKVMFTLLVMKIKRFLFYFLLLQTIIENITFWFCQNVCGTLSFLLDDILKEMVLSYTYKLLVFKWIQIALTL